MPTDKRTLDFIRKMEGYEPEAYEDMKGIETIGYGANTQSPDYDKIVRESASIDPSDGLDKAEADELLKKQLQEKIDYYQNIKKRDFPNFADSEEQRIALESMMYNSPKTVGPNMRKALNENDIAAATKEIMLHTNPEKSPGLQKRRLNEARQFAGESFPRVIDELAPEEHAKIVELLNSMKNEHERIRVLNEFPEFKEHVKRPKFKKLFRE